MNGRGRTPRWGSVFALIAIGSVVGVTVASSAEGLSAPAVVSSIASFSEVTSAAALTLSFGTDPSTVASNERAAPVSDASSLPAALPLALGHVWWIVMENHEYGAIIGNRAAPYLNGLAARFALATRYYATGHPSEPNYIALVAGSTLGVTSDGIYHLAHPSLFSQLARVGRTWRVYAQDDRSGCFTGSAARGGRDGPGAAGTYARKHNPAISFTSVAGSPGQCRNIQPLRAFDPGAAPFEMIVPNLTNDMHDGTIGQGDAFLRAFVPHILASAAYRAGGVLFITFDEGGSSAGSLGDHGGHVATLVISPRVARGYRYRAYADHWSLLRTTERILGLPCLANACRRSPIF